VGARSQAWIRQMWTMVLSGFALAVMALILAWWLDWAWAPAFSAAAVALTVSGVVHGIRVGRRQNRST
jgi:hypothetical protein